MFQLRRMNQDILDRINTDFKNALIYEDKFSKIEALSEVAKETASSNLPEAIKSRILKAVCEHEFQIVGLIDRDLTPCFIF